MLFLALLLSLAVPQQPPVVTSPPGGLLTVGVIAPVGQPLLFLPVTSVTEPPNSFSGTSIISHNSAIVAGLYLMVLPGNDSVGRQTVDIAFIADLLNVPVTENAEVQALAVYDIQFSPGPGVVEVSYSSSHPVSYTTAGSSWAVLGQDYWSNQSNPGEPNNVPLRHAEIRTTGSTVTVGLVITTGNVAAGNTFLGGQFHVTSLRLTKHTNTERIIGLDLVTGLPDLLSWSRPDQTTIALTSNAPGFLLLSWALSPTPITVNTFLDNNFWVVNPVVVALDQTNTLNLPTPILTFLLPVYVQAATIVGGQHLIGSNVLQLGS